MTDPTVHWEPVAAGDGRADVRVDEGLAGAGRRLWPSLGEYPVYDDFLYSVMVDDETRNARFGEAIRAVARDRVVTELGTGPDLLWASLAAASGARRVLAVEVAADSAREAKRQAARLGAHVEVFHGDAVEVSLPVQADVCIVELAGAIGGAEGIAAVVADAWRRHLRPGAVVVPHRVRTRISALAARELLGGPPALHPSIARYAGKVLRSTGSVFDLRMGLTGLTPADLVCTAGVLEDLNLGANTQRHSDQVHLEVTRPGAIDSGLLWLELQCAPGQESIDSLATETNWVPILLPFDRDSPVTVQPGDTLDLGITRRLYDAVHPEWTFAGVIRRRDRPPVAVRSESAYAHGPFRQSWLHRALLREADPAAPAVP